MFMTEDQKKYYNAMKKMGSKKPMKAIPRPKVRMKRIWHVILLMIVFNSVVVVLLDFKCISGQISYSNRAVSGISSRTFK